MSGYEGEGTDFSGGGFAGGDWGGDAFSGYGSAKPGETAMAQAEAAGVGAGRALSNIERQGMGWGSVEGFNLNNPTQSVDEMANSENVSNALSSIVGYNPRAETTGFNAVLNSPFGQLARSFLSFSPMGTVFNAAASLYSNRNDPMKAGLGLVPGWGGTLARAGYAATQANDPLASLANSALMTGAGMLGGRLGGSLGARAGANLAGQFMGPGGASRSAPAGGGFSPAPAQEQFAAQGEQPPGGMDSLDQRWAELLQTNFGGPG
jgi:hypothetical protein